ncbi:MAG TPA: N,N-dimethylformamidase beta subunit family domain-containing protein [Candidatus Nitrosotalea sp.]|nr:N,N-dimethylformamidase beta subunit family domain-containing protein [Candidatus Nitrosotalea sp.]
MQNENSQRRLQKQKSQSAISRRDLLKGALGAGAAAALSGCMITEQEQRDAAKTPSHKNDLIRRENEKPGTRDWLLTNTRIDPATKYRCPWIEGYCSLSSVRAGETISFFVSTNPPSPFRIDVYRMGFYGGAGGRQVSSLGPFKGAVQPDPPVGQNRVRECRWEPCATIRIPRDWLSGVYLGKLTAERGGFQSYVIFIVRDDRRADYLVQCSDTTWQAYNRWPSQFALYDDGHEQWYWGPGVDVSFNRPYGKYCQILDAPLSTGSGEWFLWEFPLAHWMESQGRDVTYISNLDTHTDPKGLSRAKGFLSIGHDEYYSIDMFNQLRAAIDAGLNVAFLSGNVCCGRIQFKPDAGGVANRVFERVDFFGPRDEAEIKRFPTMGRLPHQSPNSSLLVGAGNVAPTTGGADWICMKPDHWLFEGTNMKQGDGIPGLVGWEWHGDPASISGLEVVATGPTQDAPGKLNGGVYTATIHPGPKGNFVFNASSCWWADGLSEPPGYLRPSVYTTPKGPDVRAQRITSNVLDRMRVV